MAVYVGWQFAGEMCTLSYYLLFRTDHYTFHLFEGRRDLSPITHRNSIFTLDMYESLMLGRKGVAYLCLSESHIVLTDSGYNQGYGGGGGGYDSYDSRGGGYNTSQGYNNGTYWGTLPRPSTAK